MTISVSDVAHTSYTDGVTAEIRYLAHDSHQNRLYLAPGKHLSTARYESDTSTVGSARNRAGGFSLDENGFTLVQHRSAATDFYENDEVEGICVPEALEIVKRLSSAALVLSNGLARRRASVDPHTSQPAAGEMHVDVHPVWAEQSAARIRSKHGMAAQTFRPRSTRASAAPSVRFWTPFSRSERISTSWVRAPRLTQRQIWRRDRSRLLCPRSSDQNSSATANG